MAEGGDFLIPMRQGLFQESHLQGDLADLVSKTKEGRKSPSEVTMFNSLGLAIEDLQCAIYLYKTISEEASSSSSSPQSASTVRLMSRL
jgi:ornithine cyclodeaminase